MPQNTEYKDSAETIGTVTYKKRLNSWAIARLHPENQKSVIARFRSRSDADGHMQLLQQMNPDAEFLLIYDFQ
ncbi:hypothetical protein [Calothrix sp. 336/3]|uniref:hypothetical protein n=1 Tax=Calothrix sp. 336/3 TaxID=1337936 RepID=UPI0004E29A1B|nr:hypothetical protein [Calothrix sp. 336/3]AKG22278.1 hypothetical protein IJ00_14315 [Calothrix sp. 336/3]